MNLFRKVISLVLVAATLFSLVAVAGSAESYDHLPQVYVQGFESKEIYYKDDPEKNPLLYPIDTDRLLGNAAKIGDYVKESLGNLDPAIIYNYVYGFMWDTFGMTALGTDGYTMNELVTVDETELNYDGDGKYVFKYDSRLDPVDIAKELKEYIGWVKEDSGSDRFELVGSSFGTSVVLAYLNEYGWDDVDTVLLCVPSVEGINFVGELFSGSFNFDPDAIESFAGSMIDDENIMMLISVLNQCGILDLVLACAVEPLLKVALTRALHDVIHDILATHPAMWAFIEDEYFYDALKYIYGKNYKDASHEYAVLINKVIYYHENIKVKDRELLTKVMNDGIGVNVICKYNMPPFPLSEDGNFMGDGFVELTKASFGCTTSMFGETLGEGYKQAKLNEYNLLSVDGCIDASTCFIPLNTWFISGMNHGDKNDDYYALIADILYNDINVFSNPEHPQFLQLNEDEDTLSPLEKPEPKEEMSFFEMVITLIKNLFNIIVEAIKSKIGG